MPGVNEHKGFFSENKGVHSRSVLSHSSSKLYQYFECGHVIQERKEYRIAIQNLHKEEAETIAYEKALKPLLEEARELDYLIRSANAKIIRKKNEPAVMEAMNRITGVDSELRKDVMEYITQENQNDIQRFHGDVKDYEKQKQQVLAESEALRNAYLTGRRSRKRVKSLELEKLERKLRRGKDVEESEIYYNAPSLEIRVDPQWDERLLKSKMSNETFRIVLATLGRAYLKDKADNDAKLKSALHVSRILENKNGYQVYYVDTSVPYVDVYPVLSMQLNHGSLHKSAYSDIVKGVESPYMRTRFGAVPYQQDEREEQLIAVATKEIQTRMSQDLSLQASDDLNMTHQDQRFVTAWGECLLKTDEFNVGFALEKNKLAQLDLHFMEMEGHHEAALLNSMVVSNRAIELDITQSIDETKTQILDRINEVNDQIAHHYNDIIKRSKEDKSLYVIPLAEHLNAAIVEFLEKQMKNLPSILKEYKIKSLNEKYKLYFQVESDGTADLSCEQNWRENNRDVILAKINLAMMNLKPNNDFLIFLKKNISLLMNSLSGVYDFSSNGKSVIYQENKAADVQKAEFLKHVETELAELNQTISQFPFPEDLLSLYKKNNTALVNIQKILGDMEVLHQSVSAVYEKSANRVRLYKIMSPKDVEEKELVQPVDIQLDGLHLAAKKIVAMIDEVRRPPRGVGHDFIQETERYMMTQWGMFSGLIEQEQAKMKQHEKIVLSLVSPKEIVSIKSDNKVQEILGRLKHVTLHSLAFWERCVKVGGTSVTVYKMDYKVPARIAHFVNQFNLKEAEALTDQETLKRLMHFEDKPASRSSLFYRSVKDGVKDVIRSKKTKTFFAIIDDLKVLAAKGYDDDAQLDKIISRLDDYHQQYKTELDEIKLSTKPSKRSFLKKK